MKPHTTFAGILIALCLGLVVLTGCYTADRPLSATAAKDERLEGIWYLQSMPGHDDEAEGPFHHLEISARGSLYRIKIWETSDDTHPNVYQMQLTRDGDLEAMNLLLSPQSDNDPMYQFFPYEVEQGGEQDKLTLYEFPDDTLTQAVNQGMLRGVIEPDQSIRVTDTEAALREFVRSTTQPPLRKPYLILLRDPGC